MTGTDVESTAKLQSWGWNAYDQGLSDYCNFDKTGYWGIDTLLDVIEVSKYCRKDGGNWDPIALLHWDLSKDESIEEQEYTDPSGTTHKVSRLDT